MALITSILASLRDDTDSGIYFIYSGERQDFLSYRDLYHLAVNTLARLQARGIRQGDEVILLTENNRDFLVVFWACLFGGIIPIPLPASTQEDHLQKLTVIWKQLTCPYLVTEAAYYAKWEGMRSDGGSEGAAGGGVGGDGVHDRSRVLDIQPLTVPGDEQGTFVESTADSLAYLQYSSGSTGEPKGVTLTHRNIVTNARAIVVRSQMTRKDHSLSWMPLSHDMGLVCFHLANAYAGANQYIMPTSLFIRNPRLWIDMTDEYRVTQLYSPNYGYHYFMSAVADYSSCHWDLSSVRIIYNGAEPISHMLCEKFLRCLAPFGLKRGTFMPGYGLAEASVAVALPIPGEEIRVRSLSRKMLKVGEKIAEGHSSDAIDFVETGFPVDECEVRVCGPADEVYGEDRIGHIQIRGGNVTRGYYNNEKANQTLLAGDGWLRTGDLGFVANGRLTITGRAKNLIIINGKNYYPHDLEQMISASLEKFDLGKVVITGVLTKEVESEALLVFILFKESVEKFVPYIKEIKAILLGKTGLIPVAVIPLPKIPKTTSGKVRHFALKEKYIAGQYTAICDQIDRLLKATEKPEAQSGLALEDQLAFIWEEVVGKGGMSPERSFFDAGMTSLQAMQFANQVRQKAGVNLSVSEIFTHSSFEKIAAFIRRSQPSGLNRLVAAEEQEHYPATEIQKRFWLLSQLQEQGTAFNLGAAVVMEGEPDVPSLGRAVGLVVAAHEIFQTRFVELDGNLRQKIDPGMMAAAGIFCYRDVRGAREARAGRDVREPWDVREVRQGGIAADELAALAEKEIGLPFDPERGPLIRCTLFHLDDKKYLFVLAIHHLITDGWSIDLLIQHIRDTYRRLKSGSAVALAAPRMSFRDYAIARQRDLGTTGGQRDREYWMQSLWNPPAAPDLPFTRARAAVQTFRGAGVTRAMPLGLLDTFRKLAGENNATLFSALAAALRILLYRYTGQTDMVIGTDAAGRTHPDWEPVLGCYINTLPLRSQLQAEDDFLRVLGREAENLLNALKHQEYPFDRMIVDLGLRKEFSRTPLFDVLLLFRDWDLGLEKLDEQLSVRVLDLAPLSSIVDLELEFFYRKEALFFTLKFNPDLFDALYMERMAGHFLRLLESITEDPWRSIATLDILTVPEKQELASFQSGVARESGHQNIVQIFEERVCGQPDAAALTGDSRTLSYEQLNVAANQLADYLMKSEGIRQGDRIGLLKRRSVDAIVGSIAILKAGGTCVPVDPETPTDRIQFIMGECGCRLLLSDAESWKDHALLPYPVVFTDEHAELAAFARTNPATDRDGEALAYILYTSGSEGRPKGVMLRHKSIAGYIRTFGEYFEVGPKDRILQQAILSFDISLEEIYSALGAGACLVISAEGGRDIDKMVGTIKREKVTIVSATPLVIDGLNAAGYAGLESLRILINGGDRLNPGNIDKLFPHLDIYNTYGPTETTICVTYHKVKNLEDMGVIGRPLPGHQIYIAGTQMQPVPVGVEGEICISGTGVAQGYVNNSVGRDVFIDNPFEPGAPMYRTGDFGRWLPDGTIRLTGRKDSQMKWQGYRVEAGEIEKRLLLYDGVTNAVVRVAGKRPRLTAYLVCGRDIDVADLRSYLGRSLPSYMIPASVVGMDVLPLTANGKLDLRALPDPVGADDEVRGREGLLPANAAEARMKELWLDVLKWDDLGVLDNFFEAGGNSLQATSIVNRIRNVWGARVSLRDLLVHPSIREISEFLVGAGEVAYAGEAGYEVIPVLSEQPVYRVSLQQRRLWILHQVEEDDTSYNLSWSFGLRGEGVEECLIGALAGVAERHESLRTVFVTIDGEPYIKVRDFDRSELPIVRVDIRGKAVALSWEALILEDAVTSFDLEKGPLYRVKIIRTGDDEFRVGMTIHHIITDGWSMNLIWRELNERMAGGGGRGGAEPGGGAGPDGRVVRESGCVTYKDYAAWQNGQVGSPAMKAHGVYWYDRLQGMTSWSGAFLQGRASGSGAARGKSRYFRLAEQTTAGIAAIAKDNRVTEFTVYLALLKLLLFRYTGHTDIVISTPFAGRNQKDLEGLAGYFLNILPLRTNFSAGMSFSELLDATRTTVLGAYEHKDYPVEELIRKLGLGDHLHFSPMFDVMFVLQNFDRHPAESDGSLPGSPRLSGIEEVDNGTCIGKLLVEVNSFGEGTTLKIRYDTGVFAERQIERMAGHLEQLVMAVRRESGCALYQYDIFSVAEKREMLKDERVEEEAEVFLSLFRRAVAEDPDRVALMDDEHAMTYGQLDRATDGLAAHLRKKGIARGNRLIGILLRRSERLVVSMLAVWKAGGAYIPLDPEYPAGRIALMIEDALPDMVISESGSLELIPEGVSGIINWEEREEWEGAVWKEEEERECEGERELAYIMYTSGSTGVPKGVMIRHSSVANYIRCFTRYFAVTSDDRIIQQSSPAFDVCVEEIFPVLSVGGTLLIAREGGRDIPKLLDLIGRNEATILSTTPHVVAELNGYADRLHHLRVLISGGDRLKAHQIDGLIGKANVYNTYGPTETTVCVTYQPVNTRGDEVSIGPAVGHHTIYILDEFQHLRPAGFAGEIGVAGPGLARGYLNRPEETDRKFIENKFGGRDKIYRTGDIGYKREDGSIVFLGRKDGQLKINGYRVETDEIENALAGLSGIRQAAIVPVSGPDGVQGIKAFYIAEGVIARHELRAGLLKVLPFYMIPATFVRVDAFPLTQSGKIDYSAFPDAEEGADAEEGGDLREGLSGKEEQLAGIWASLLGRPVNSKADNFFLLGGNSIKAVQLIQRVVGMWGGELSLKDVFYYPVLSELALLLGSRGMGRQEKVSPLPEAAFYDVAHAQQRLWVLSQLEDEGSAYHISLCFRLDGLPDRPVLERALATLVGRHESLRTTFRMREGRLQQRIHPVGSYVPVLEWEEMLERGDGPMSGDTIIDLAVAEQKKPFDLENGPLFRVKLFHANDARAEMEADARGERETALFLCLHHIISDGWSVSVLIQELATLYNAYRAGKGNPLPALPFQYKDYAYYLNARMSAGTLDADRDYWLGVFRDDIPALELPTDFPRPAARSAGGGSVQLTLDRAFSDEVRQFAERRGATVFVVMLAALEVLLYHHTGQEDMVIGTPVTGREDQGLEGQVGCYINTLPLRMAVPGMESFDLLMQKTRERVIESSGHQRFPFDNLVEVLRPERDLSRSPLFDVMLAMEDISLGERDVPIDGLKTERIAVPATSSKFDLTLYVFDTGEGFDLVLEYCTDLFRAERVAGMLGHYRNILERGMAEPLCAVGRMDILSKAERLQQSGGKPERFMWRMAVTGLIEEQASYHPGSRAVVYGKSELSFADLNRKADLVADRLAGAYRVGSNDLIGLMMDRSEKMVIALLGILKSGGAYVPLDPAYPAERNQYVINDCALKVVVTEEKYRDRFGGEVGCLLADQLLKAQPAPVAGGRYEGVRIGRKSMPDDIAYIIYTSGSTGRPKGIPVPHKNVAALVDWAAEEFGEDGFGIVYASTSYCFDLSVFEMLYPLSIGKPVRILHSGLEIEDYLAADRNVLINTVPGVIEKLLKDNADLSTVVSINMAGERIPDRVHQRMETGKIRFRNLYGPSEDTTYSTSYRFEDNTGPIYIGKPVKYSRVYLLNKERQLVPPAVKGEICMAGDGVVDGYLNRPELTAERFIGNPLVEGERLYCTGDWGRWSADGNLEFLGRKDDQVKIRGFRIEPREIEAVLGQLEGIEKSLVITAAVPGAGLQLMAFCTGTGEQAATGAGEQAAIKAHLERYLPAYMIPSRISMLERFPLTPNGKIDRKALLSYAEPDGSGGYLPPRNPGEVALAAIWEEVLERDKIGVRDNFFALGGHSILAARLISKATRVFGVKLGLKEVFQHPTIERMQVVIGKLLAVAGRAGKAAVKEITAIEEQDHYGATHMQRRMWVLDRMAPGNIAYNMSGVYRIEGPLSLDRLRKAYQLLAERHEILRTRFVTVSGEIREKTYPADREALVVDYEDCRGKADAEGREAGDVRADAGKVTADAEEVARLKAIDCTARVFDLEKGPLVALKVVQFDEDRYFLAVVMHHIVSDGWSMRVIVREVIDYYNRLQKDEAIVSVPLSFQYKDYAAWRRSQEASPWFMQQGLYWKRMLAGDIQPVDIPADKPRPAVKTYNGGELYTVLDIKGSLISLAARYNATVYMLLTATMKALLYRYTAQEDILIGMPASGRWQAGLEEQIGFYVNTLTIRTKVDGNGGFAGLLEQVRSQVLAALEHQDYPFDKLVDELNIRRDITRSPLFDIMIVYQESAGGGVPEVENLKIDEVKLPSGVSKFDLTITFEDIPEGLGVRLEYNADVFSGTRMEQLQRHFETILASIIRDQDSQVMRLNYLPEAEKIMVLEFGRSAVDAGRGEVDAGRGRSGAGRSDENEETGLTIVTAFERQVLRHPQVKALCFGERTLTYGQLNEAANKVARYLRDVRQIGRTETIGLMMDRSDQLIVALLGILKSGACYTPIDPAYPASRRRYMIHHSGLKLLLTEKKYADSAAEVSEICLMDDCVQIHEQPGDNLPPCNAAGDLAYVMYTSGTTGVPKAAMIEHRSVIGLSDWLGGLIYDHHPAPMSVLLNASISFDSSVKQLYPALLHGATLVMVTEEVHRDPKALAAELEVRKIDVWDCTPGYLVHMLGEIGGKGCCPAYTLAGGERLGGEVVRRYYEVFGERSRLINVYGVTEATVDSTFCITRPELPGVANIGKPLPGTEIYLLDRNQEVVPMGFTGEICIGGGGLARGYLHDEGLTREKFIDNPFGKGRLYRTGDLGKWLPDGSIDFAGRMDRQVKVSGHRVELAEIEHTLTGHKDIQAAIVIAHDEPSGGCRLAAYFVSNCPLELGGVKSFVEKRLPSYMVPSWFIPLASMPLNDHGKVDVRRLPDPATAALRGSGNYVQAGDMLEKKLAGIWEELLEYRAIGIHDNFFDVGGNSMKVIQLHQRIQKDYPGGLEIYQIFSHPTIKELADLLREGDGTEVDKTEEISVIEL